MKRIELHPAYVWDCDECGSENFARAVVPEMTDEDEDALREDYGIESWEEGGFQMMPTHVACRYCGERYETESQADLD